MLNGENVRRTKCLFPLWTGRSNKCSQFALKLDCVASKLTYPEPKACYTLFSGVGVGVGVRA